MSAKKKRTSVTNSAVVLGLLARLDRYNRLVVDFPNEMIFDEDRGRALESRFSPLPWVAEVAYYWFNGKASQLWLFDEDDGITAGDPAYERKWRVRLPVIGREVADFLGRPVELNFEVRPLFADRVAAARPVSKRSCY